MNVASEHSLVHCIGIKYRRITKVLSLEKNSTNVYAFPHFLSTDTYFLTQPNFMCDVQGNAERVVTSCKALRDSISNLSPNNAQ